MGRLADWTRRVRAELRATLAELGGSMRGLTRACTCGDPRHHGPCPRHHTMG